MKKTKISDRACNICGHDKFSPVRQRSDGLWVIKCKRCGMGVLRNIPDDLSVFYGDTYYSGERESGYLNYEFMAEHGVAWAAAIVKCLKPSGRVLDVGCVDGYLLRRLDDSYERFGIEVNEAMAVRAAQSSVTIIAHDLFAENVLRDYAGTFDVVTSIAVFEHLRDFRGGIEASLELLKEDGVLLFEVPLLSETHDNNVWFTSSLEHVYYPTETGIRRLVEEELGFRLVGGEVRIRDYASTYVGVLTKDPAVAGVAAALYARLTSATQKPRGDSEREARLQLHLVHSATSTEELIGDLNVLPTSGYTPGLIRRLQQVWSLDLHRQNQATEKLGVAEEQTRQLITACDEKLGAAEEQTRQLITARDWLNDQVTQARTALDHATAHYDKGQSELAHMAARLQRSEAETFLKAAEAERAQAQVILATVRIERAEGNAESTREALNTVNTDKERLATQIQAVQAELETAANEARGERQRFAALQEEADAAAASARQAADAAESDRERLLADLLFAQAERDTAFDEAGKQRQRLVKLDEELTFRRREADRSEANMSVTSQDLKLNVAQMVRSMIAGEERYHAAVRQAVALEQERDAIWGQLQALLNSNMWKATVPVQLFARRYPPISRALRKALKASWKALGLGKHVLNVIQQRDDQLASMHQVDATLAPTPSAFSLGPLPMVGNAQDAPKSDETVWPFERPLVSVVIPCFNYGHFVHEAIESVLSQTLTDVEVIVVEGGSTSLKSRQMLAELRYPGVRVLLQDAPNRVGANRNFGVKHARGKYICCLDADDKIHATYLEKAVFMLEHYEYDVVSTRLSFFGDCSGTWDPMEQPALADLLQANQVLTCAVVRRSFWEKAGGIHDFEVPEGHLHEDWAFWIRLAALGARFFNITGERLLQYRSHGPSLSNQGVLPVERQLEIMRNFNADVLGSEAIERSSALAAEERRANQPLRDLIRFGRAVADDRRTVLLAMPFTIIGGAERLLSGIVRHLTQTGWRVVLVTTVPVGPEHGDTTGWFGESTREIYHLPRFLAPNRWPDAVEYLFEAKVVDLLWIVGSAFFYDLIPGLKAAHPHLRIVDLLFNTVGHTDNNRKHARSIDLTIVENKEVRDWLVDHGESENRITVIESGVTLDPHGPRGKDRALLEALGIEDGALLVGFSGRWSEEKDPLGFVEIARRTRARNVAFVMTGTGHMRPQLEAVLAEAELPLGRFHLIGPVPDVSPYIGSYDVLCLPSTIDGRPVVVLEALSMGVPVLASRVGALPELVEDAVSGFLVEPGDYDSFARLIDELAARPDTLERMKVQARLSAERNLDARRMLAEYEAALAAALGGAHDTLGRSHSDQEGWVTVSDVECDLRV